ncbi:MAG: hypothetical protein U0271_39530 [Polyangiaceae bacterium]
MPPSIAARVQSKLEALYGVEAPEIDPFIVSASEGRESLLVRQTTEELELAVHLPEVAVRSTRSTISFDVFCQVIEGVSHFLCVVERARRELPVTELELELQAEVDKFVIAASTSDSHGGLRCRLYEHVRFLHPSGSERGDRYRLANQLAARFTRTLCPSRVQRRDHASVGVLRQFFAAGQREKLEMVLAA